MPPWMPITLDAHLLTVLLVVALVVWRGHARMRRLVGRQRLSSVRPWITVVVFPLIAALALLTSVVDPRTAIALVAGAFVGSALGVVGRRLTRFEVTTAGLFYTPNAHLGIALSLLMVLRLGYRFVMLQLDGRQPDPQALPLGAGPLTMALFGMLAGYYVTYAIGLLRWRAQVGRQAAVEH
jgi:hypothetical protein